MYRKAIIQVAVIIGLLVFLIAFFLENENKKAEEKRLENLKELDDFGLFSEALTLNYRWSAEQTKGRRQINFQEKNRIIDYIYFVNGNKYISSQVIEGNPSRFGSFNKYNPMIWQVQYSSKNPSINRIFLNNTLDTVENIYLQNYILKEYGLPNMAKFYKIFYNKPEK